MMEIALMNLRPGSVWETDGANITRWVGPGIQPTQEEISAEMARINTPTPDWDGFRQWRRQNPDYLALMGGPHGNLVGFLEADISRGDYASAAVLWDSLKQQGAITANLETALTNAISQFNLGDLGAALIAHNQAQN